MDGTKRYLAAVSLHWNTILCLVRSGELDEIELEEEAIIMAMAHMHQEPLSKKDLIGPLTTLYRYYGNVDDVCNQTGFSRATVTKYVNFDKPDRLSEPGKTLFKEGQSRL